MKKQYLIITGVSLLVSSLLLMTPTSYAEQTVEDLKQQVEMLKKRVGELESRQQPAAVPAYYYPQRQTWDPFDEIRRMQEEMNRMMQSSFTTRGWTNGGVFSNDLSFDYDFDLEEKKDQYEVHFDMSKLDQDKVQVDINDNAITIKGEYSNSNEEESQDRFVSARSYGSFMKTIPIPDDADTSKVKTEKKEKELVIILPKKS